LKAVDLLNDFNPASDDVAVVTLTNTTTTVTGGATATALADVPTVAEFNARTLVAASYFDPAADTVANVTLVATTTTNTDMVGTNGANTVVPPSVAQFNARTILSAAYFDPAADAVANVTLVATTTTNTDMVGTDNAATSAQMVDLQGSGFSTSTDSNEAIRNRGDAAWTTGGGGSNPTVLQNTTIATLASQTSFTLTAGSADNDAYNKMFAVITDASTSTQKAIARVSDYVGSTKTITLEADPAIFTMATGDTIDIIAQDPFVPPSVAEFDARTLPTATYFDPANDDVAVVTLTNTATTVTNAVTANATQIGGSTSAATQLALSTNTIVSASAVTGTLSTTEMTTDLTETTDDHYIGRIIIWTSGVLKDQATDITDYTGSNKLLTYTATTEAPSNTDTFIIV